MKQGWHLLQKVVLSLECTLSSSILSLPDFSSPFKCLISQIFCAITVLYTCTSICTHMYDLPHFCLGHPSEVGRQIKILLNINSTHAPWSQQMTVGRKEFVLWRYLSFPSCSHSLSEASWLSKHTLKGPLIQTEAILSLCAKCVSKARGQVGLYELRCFLAALGTSAVLLSLPHPQPPECWWRPSRAARATMIAGSLLKWMNGTENTLRAAKGLRWFPEAHGETIYNCLFAGCKHQLNGSASWPGWISVDLSNFLQQSVLTKDLCKSMHSRELTLRHAVELATIKELAWWKNVSTELQGCLGQQDTSSVFPTQRSSDIDKWSLPLPTFLCKTWVLEVGRECSP